MNEKNEVQLTLECVDLFEVTDLSDGRTQVKIVIPRRFADLWLIKLEELTATEAEIKAMCPDSS